MVAVLLTIFAITIGCAIGRIRGGKLSGVNLARFHRPGVLVLALTTMLVLNLIGPAFPLLWALIGTFALFFFGFRNLQLSGMIVLLIGLLMNTAPLLANGAVPVSELALISVGDVDDSGLAVIDGLRESTDTATAFAAFGDVIPVPIFNTVVSIGDLIMLVALADIMTNLFLRSRRREDLDSGGVTFESDETTTTESRPAVLSPLSLGVSNRPAHAAHRRPRRKAAPSTHVPAHAKQSDFFDLTDPETVIVLDGAEAYVESGVAKNKIPEVDQPIATTVPTASPEHHDVAVEDRVSKDPVAEEPAADNAAAPKTENILPDEQVAPAAADAAVPALFDADADEEPEAEDHAPAHAVEATPERVDKEIADRRPIIDLTVSPTDEQLQEFLRRRAEADAELLARTSPGPRRRRGRAPRRRAEVAEAAR